MPTDTEIFREVTKEDMPNVLGALKKEWPNHFVLYQLLTVLDDYKKAGCNWKHTLYLYGDYENGVYMNSILIELPKLKKINYYYVYTADSDQTALKLALLQTQLIPWQDQTQEFCFLFIPNKFLSAIQEAFANKHLDYMFHNNTLYWFPPHKELQLQVLPDNVYIDFLDGSHAEEMDSNWPHRFPGSQQIHKENLEKNFGLGLFRKSDKKMVSSALTNFTGGIFVLYSDPKFRGKGYAGIVVQHMVKEIRHRGRIPFCTVIKGNKPSEIVFEKTGFELFTNADYIFPKN